jgi:hypothetical protein
MLVADACAQIDTAVPSSTPSKKEVKQPTSFFETFESKDWVSFGAAITALVFSTITLYLKLNETNQALRKQLTDVLQKLADLNTEISKFRSLVKKEEYPSNYGSLINDQRQFLVRQAAFIVKRIEKLASPFEYLLIAGAFDDINEIEEADRFFKIASKTKQPFQHGIAIRGYARFQFHLGKQAEARRNFQKAINSFLGETDRHKTYLGDTYERWATLEQEWSNEDEAQKLLKLALAAYQSLRNPSRSRGEVNRIESKLKDTTPEAEGPDAKAEKSPQETKSTNH